MFSSIALLMKEGLSEFELNSSLELEEWELSTGPVISPKSIPSTSLETWIILALLVLPSRRCQCRIRKLELSEYVGRLLLYTSIVLFPLRSVLILKTNKFLCLKAIPIVLLSCLRIMKLGWSWYEILDSQSWPKDMRLESQFGVYTTLSRLIFFSWKRRYTMPTSWDRMISPLAVINS